MVASQLFENRYELIEPLGKGGMGIVYKAHDQLTGHYIALKQVLAPSDAFALKTDPHALDDKVILANEFQVLASLRHPNIISVLDYGFYKDVNNNGLHPYFTMDLLDNAKEVLQASRHLTLEGKLYLVLQILQALDYLHRRGIIHHDLKPANILVANEQVKLLDFGIALKPGQSAGTAGTLPYMAPEMLRTENAVATEATDLYSVGVILYETVTGRHPYGSDNFADLLKGIIFDAPDMKLFDDIVLGEVEEPVDYDDGGAATVVVTQEQLEYFYHQAASYEDEFSEPLPRNAVPTTPLSRIVFRLLSKDPAARYQHAIDVMQDLLSILDDAYAIESPEIRESYLQAATFVGREQEMKQLEKAIDDAIDGTGSAWLIGGESGVGKSRFIQEVRILALVRGVLVLVGQGIEGGGLPYQYWRDIVRRLCLAIELTDLEASVLKSLVPDIENLLKRPISDPPPLSSNDTKERLISTIASVIERISDTVIIVLEDLHWGYESLDILKAVISRLSKVAVLILATFRDDERPELWLDLPEMQPLRLQRLGPEDIKTLSESMLGDFGRIPTILNLLQRETEGNVFFLVETVRALAEQAGQLSKVGSMELPTTVFARGIQDIVERRLRDISTEDREILEIAAVIGRQIEQPVLAYTIQSPMTALQPWLNTCASAAILEVQGEQWRFTHDKIREGILHQIPAKTIATLNRRVAEAIEATYDDLTDYTMVLANHWRVAGDADKEMMYASQAGHSALMRGSFSDAAEMLTRALELYEKLGSEDKAWYADNVYELAQAYIHQGMFALSDKHCDAALRVAREIGYQKRIVDALALKGSLALRRGAPDDSQRYLSEALELARQQTQDDVTSDILMWLGALSVMNHTYDQAATYLDEALRLANKADNQLLIARILNTQGENYRHQQRFTDAKNVYQQSLELYQRIGHGYAHTALPLNLAHTALASGEIDLAEVNFMKVLHATRRSKEHLLTLDALAGLGKIAYQRRKINDAISLLGLVMRHPSTTAETKVFNAQPAIDALQAEVDAVTFERVYDQLAVDDLAVIVDNLLDEFD